MIKNKYVSVIVWNDDFSKVYRAGLIGDTGDGDDTNYWVVTRLLDFLLRFNIIYPYNFYATPDTNL